MRASIVISADGGSSDTARRHRQHRLDSAALPMQCITVRRHDNVPNTDQSCIHCSCNSMKLSKYFVRFFCILGWFHYANQHHLLIKNTIVTLSFIILHLLYIKEKQYDTEVFLEVLFVKKFIVYINRVSELYKREL